MMENKELKKKALKKAILDMGNFLAFTAVGIILLMLFFGLLFGWVYITRIHPILGLSILAVGMILWCTYLIYQENLDELTKTEMGVKSDE